MTNAQLWLVIGVPLALNTALVLFVWTALSQKIDAKFDALSTRVDIQFAAINQRFDDMREMWRIELQRVEEVLDARLKHLEERR